MTDFPNNSVNKPREPETQRKRVQQVVATPGRRRKKSAGKKLVESFAVDDTSSVASYILTDVLIPAAKNMISDAISQGVERKLFGDSVPRGRSSSGVRTGNYTAYSGVSSRGTVRGSAQTSGRSREREARRLQPDDYEDVVLATRGEANEVLDRLHDCIKDYEAATLSDLYELVGITGSFTDSNRGWEDLSKATVRQIRDGYLLVMPTPIHLD